MLLGGVRYKSGFLGHIIRLRFWSASSLPADFCIEECLRGIKSLYSIQTACVAVTVKIVYGCKTLTTTYGRYGKDVHYAASYCIVYSVLYEPKVRQRNWRFYMVSSLLEPFCVLKKMYGTYLGLFLLYLLLNKNYMENTYC